MTKTKQELEILLGELCLTQSSIDARFAELGSRDVIKGCVCDHCQHISQSLTREIAAKQIERAQIIAEILDEFLRLNTVYTGRLDDQLAEKRAWANAWKAAARKNRQVYSEAMRQYAAQQNRACQAEQERDEALATCTELAEVEGLDKILYWTVL